MVGRKEVVGDGLNESCRLIYVIKLNKFVKVLWTTGTLRERNGRESEKTS